MTNKEAIIILGLECDEWDISHCTASERREAFEMAISALQELDKNPTKPNNSNEQLNNSTATQFNAIKTHVKGMTACRVPGDDCISRQAAIDKVKELFDIGDCYCDKYSIVGMINSLPSVQPEQDREFLKLTVRNSNGRPYYSIIYLEVDDNGVGHDFEGYSSYSLDVISDYLKKYFMPSAQPEPERTMEEFMYGQDMGNPEDGSL